jgi:PAS domain S-box-containing protein
MPNTEPLSLFHSWPLFDMAERMKYASLALLDPADIPDAAIPILPATGIGIWQCDLTTGQLSWSAEVCELFGLPANVVPTRAFALACYEPHSLEVLQSLREHAIKHRRGFTMDAMIRRADGEARWIRLTAMPVMRGGKVVRLVGTKEDVTLEHEESDWSSDWHGF